jgi:multidrug efflux pump subunit AcrA (membrane-fusion protein)
MFAQVKIESPVQHRAVVVPAEAVMDTGVKQHVFLALGKGRFAPREVKLGVEGNDGLREVLSGLEGGEEVVTSAQFLLDSESRFREAVQMMLAPAATPAPGKEGAPPAAPAPEKKAAPPPGVHKH